MAPPQKENLTGTSPAERRNESNLNAPSAKDYHSTGLPKQNQTRTDTSTTAKKDNTTKSQPLTAKSTVTT
jgi:hypothetical protein